MPSAIGDSGGVEPLRIKTCPAENKENSIPKSD